MQPTNSWYKFSFTQSHWPVTDAHTLNPAHAQLNVDERRLEAQHTDATPHAPPTYPYTPLTVHPHLPVHTLQLSVNERGLKVQRINILSGRLFRHIKQTVPHPGVRLTQAEGTSQFEHIVWSNIDMWE